MWRKLLIMLLAASLIAVVAWLRLYLYGIYVMGLLLLAVVVYMVYLIGVRLKQLAAKQWEKKKSKEKKEHAKETHASGSHGHGHQPPWFVALLTTVIAVGLLGVIVFAVGQFFENRADDNQPPRAVSWPSAPATDPLPCGESERDPFRFRLLPGSDSPWLEGPAETSPLRIMVNTPPGASYQFCTRQGCIAPGEMMERGVAWYLRNTGETEFTMACWTE